MNRIKNLKLAVVALAASCLTMAASAQDNTLLGAGSTFVYPLFSKIFSKYTPSKVNYQSIGSGGGILQLTNKTVDFGDSDAPLNADQTAKIERTCFAYSYDLGRRCGNLQCTRCCQILEFER